MRKKQLTAGILALCMSISLLSCNTKKTTLDTKETTKENAVTESASSKETETKKNTAFERSTRFTKPDYKKGTKTSAEFTAFCDEYFKKAFEEDPINLHYSVAYPEKIGITEIPKKFKRIDISKIGDTSEIEQTLKDLEAFDYDALTLTQQQTYDIMYADLNVSLEYKDVALYGNNFGKSNGIQSMLPVMMAEYTLNNEADVENYLSLLADVYGYYENLLEYERYRQSKGICMSDFLIDGIIEQCNAFIENPENHYLISTFNDRIEKLDSISPAKKAAYEEQNKQTVNTVIIPAYKMLIQEFSNFKGKGKATGGITNYHNYQRYYEYLMKTVVGTEKNPGELNALYSDNIKKTRTALSALIITNSELLEQLDDPKFPITEPDKIIEDLKVKITDRFPSVPEVQTVLHPVHESLSEFLAPAFYINSPVDKYDIQNIYINNIDNTISGLYPTIAHEGYPGHLYQHLYYSTIPHEKTRDAFSFSGYSEGWATYVEIMSYEFAGLDNKLASGLQSYTLLMHCIYGQMDIGLNYYAWDRNQLASYVKTNIGITPTDEILDQICSNFYEEPGNYLNYSIGYLEFIELKNRAKKILGDKFNEKEFHEFILSFGEAQFNIIDYYMDKWMEEKMQ